MCLFIDDAVETTALEPIKVFKVLRNDNTSPYRKFKYEKGITYRLRKKLKTQNNLYIRDGFHSYRNMCGARKEISLWDDRCKICVFVIPRGAKYYIGMHNDVVSTSIRLIN